MEGSATSSRSTSFHDFLHRMRHPSSLDLVRAIKSFIVSFSFYQPKPENDGQRVQDFFLSMEVAIRNHPLWATATEEDIDCAMEGLEKYIMTKLFSRTFATSPEDVKIDHEISEKISLLQTFLKPEHLDIPPVLHNEASWLLAEKELQKINAFKAPQEKLSTIMNCCRVINNLLLNAAMAEHVPAGADDFIPVLIYVTIKANPPMLHSNLKFIKLYRRQTKLISEAEYYFTNLVSAKTFIIELNAKSLSIDENKFEECMQAAKLAKNVTSELHSTCQIKQQVKNESNVSNKMHNKLDTKDAEFRVLQHGTNYPYMEAESKDLAMEDVDILLNHYKDLVAKYTIICKAINCLSMSEKEPLLHQLEMQGEGRFALFSQNRILPKVFFSDKPVCVITGATSGLGLSAACKLSKEGYVVVIVGRSEQLLEETITKTKGWNEDALLKAFQADLSSVESIIKFNTSLRQWLLDSDLHCSVQILINNAGILATSPRVTAEGYDQMIGTNYIGPFVMTKLLLLLLESSHVSSKIVNVTSFTHRAVCLLLFSYELHRQLCQMVKSHQIFVNVADPGFVQTNIMREVPASLSWVAFFVLKRLRLLESSECGNDSIIDAALTPPGTSGAYFFGGKGRTINS